MAKKKKKECWKNSKAKAKLYEDIVEGRVPVEPTGNDLKPKQLFEQRYQHLPEFQLEDYSDLKLFGSRLRGLRKAISLQYERAETDRLAFYNDRRIHPQPTFNDMRGYPSWNGHAAQRRLRHDIEMGKHKRMSPIQLWQTQPIIYQVFPLKVFRNHIYSELRRRKKRSKKKIEAKDSRK